MKIVIVSHNFNPGHFSHLYASYKLVSDAGLIAGFYWNDRFDEFIKDDEKFKIPKFNIIDILKDDIYLVCFPSLKALIEMVYLRLTSKSQIIYVLHEPFDSIRAYLNSGFGILKTLRIVVISFVNYLMVQCAHKIILPSDKALKTFKSRYNFSGKYTKIPLIFDDESEVIPHLSERKYISYIGTIAEDHAFDKYIEFILYALSKGLYPEYRFLIATRSILDGAIADQLEKFVNEKKVIIVSGNSMSNSEINSYFEQSVVVWNVYRRSMQSGILPKSYMFGTPVIISDKNRSEHFINTVTGEEVIGNYNTKDIVRSIDLILDNFSRYSKNCRKFFLQHFFYKSFSDEFMFFLIENNKDK